MPSAKVTVVLCGGTAAGGFGARKKKIIFLS